MTTVRGGGGPRGCALLLACLTLLTACTQATAKPIPPEQVQLHLAQGPTLGYVARLPRGYSAKSKKTYPTIVFLHGYGERGTGTTASLKTLEGTGLPQLVATHTLPVQAQPFVILMPQTNDEAWNPKVLHAWLAQVLPQYRVDKDRTYLTGLSIGGGGVVNYLQTYGDSGEFAAIVPIAEDFVAQPEPLALPSCQAMEKTPMWLFHGDLDDTVSNGTSKALALYLNKNCHERERVKLTIFLSTFHNAWDRTYDLSGMDPRDASPDYDPYNVDIYTWMLQHRRKDRL
jgi:predicted peptidase